MTALLGFCLCLSLVVALAGCQRQAGPPDGRYQLKGEVVSIDKPNHELVVKHEAVVGLMAAMTMTYKVKNDSELALSSNGDSITADVVVVNGDMWLENVRITQRSNARPKKTGGPN